MTCLWGQGKHAPVATEPGIDHHVLKWACLTSNTSSTQLAEARKYFNTRVALSLLDWFIRISGEQKICAKRKQSKLYPRSFWQINYTGYIVCGARYCRVYNYSEWKAHRILFRKNEICGRHFIAKKRNWAQRSSFLRSQLEVGVEGGLLMSEQLEKQLEKHFDLIPKCEHVESQN